ncbi:MAG: DUF2189 domain-containing protein [Alcanivoracaceae bacterium]|nr:DUF2189 domain-containing protein [Alcanivoracaceae bacterium]
MVENNNNIDNDSEQYIKPLVAPCRTVGMDAPYRWLKKGFLDFKRVPRLSLSYGIVMVFVSILITYVAYSAHSIVLSIALVAGFFFMGPAIAIGLYSMSRQLDNGVTPKFLRCIKEGKRYLGNEMVLAFVFLIVFLIWARAASMVHIFFPSMSSMSINDWLVF